MSHLPAAFLLSALTLSSLAEADPLVPRPIVPKPVRTVINPEVFTADQVVLKFHEGTHTRLRDGALSFDASRLTEEDRRRLARLELSEDRVFGDVHRANELFGSTGVVLYRLLDRPEDAIDLERPPLERQEGEELADLNLYFMVRLNRPDPSAAAELIDALNALASVEVAYPEPLPSAPLAADQAPTTTINLVPEQTYTRPSDAGGLNFDWAVNFPGTLGTGIRIIDVEAGWTVTHEDLPNLVSFDGLNSPVTMEHGTAVLGLLGAGRNGYGITGVVTDAALGASSVIYPVFHSPFSVAAAIDLAQSRLSSGDVLLIEQQYAENFPVTSTCTCSPCSQFGYLPVEGHQANFDLIRLATARGIVVVEAAGNGGQNLDDLFYGRRFDRTFRDSRAILVGAGTATGRLTACLTSNFGSRLDVQALGENVATLGFGDPAFGSVAALRANGNDGNQFYTRRFSGTSSASALVAGAVAAVNGNNRAEGRPLLASAPMGALLRSTGVPQIPQSLFTSTVTRPIGPRVDLRAALPRIIGEVEAIDSEGVVTGYAFHSGAFHSSIEVEFEVDGVSIGFEPAGRVRPDINTRFVMGGTHGFSLQIPVRFLDDKVHVLRAIGQPLNGFPGAARVLTPTARFFKVKSFRGYVDATDSETGVVSGWAFFTPTPSASIQVYLRALSNDPNNPTPIGFFTTATPRPDVNQAFGIVGVHGFEVQLPWRMQGSTITLEVFAIDPTDFTGRHIGTRTFTWNQRPLNPWPPWGL